MKKKIITLSLVGTMVFGGVVSAASLWGTYKGNDIIRVTYDGTAIKTPDVPAISYYGRTMIPINLLGQLGIGYTWDQQNKTVDITKQMPATNNSISPSTKDSILKANMFKYLEDLGESLNFVKTGIDLEMVGKSSGVNTVNNNKTNISSAVNDYNNFIKRPDILNFGSTDASIKQTLDYYYKAIDGLKELDALLSSMPLKPGQASITNYFEISKTTSNDISNGISLASQGFQKTIYEPLK